MISDRDIERAARAIKVIHLAGQPGMDEVAIKLNCGLTWDERRQAEMWAKAFDLAATQPDLKLFDLAAELGRKIG
jgi:hypothetical protein